MVQIYEKRTENVIFFFHFGLLFYIYLNLGWRFLMRPRGTLVNEGQGRKFVYNVFLSPLSITRIPPRYVRSKVIFMKLYLNYPAIQ